jgi:hypothetical protein
MDNTQTQDPQVIPNDQGQKVSILRGGANFGDIFTPEANHNHDGLNSPFLGIQRLLTSLKARVGMGLSGRTVNIGGVYSDHYVSVGNGTTVETDLYSDSMPGNTLAKNGDKIEAEYGGSFVSSATATRQVKVYFGGTVIFDSGALTLSLSSAWTCYVLIIRVSATVVRYMVSFATEGAALSAYTAVGELTALTLTGANILKITGQAAGTGAATNDIVAKLGSISFYPSS